MDIDLPNDNENGSAINGAVANVGVASTRRQGSVTVNANGTFSSTHDGSENFSDSFTYTVSDAVANSSTATVTITITPVNDNTPVAVADPTHVAEGATPPTPWPPGPTVHTHGPDAHVPTD